MGSSRIRPRQQRVDWKNLAACIDDSLIFVHKATGNG